MPINIDHTGNLILTSDSLLTFEMTGSVRLPIGTTAQRPGAPVNGMIRYSTSLNDFEGYIDGSWQPIGSGGGASVIISDTAPASSLQPGYLWWDSISGHMNIYYDDGDSQQWVNITPSTVNGSFVNDGTYVFYSGPLNVGIGTGTPTTTLEVVGSVLIGGTVTDTPLTISSLDELAAMSFTDNTTTSAPLVGAIGNDLLFYTGNPTPTEKIRILENGNVGIDNEGPNSLLEIGNGSTRTLGSLINDTLSNLSLTYDTVNTDSIRFFTKRMTAGSDWTTTNHFMQRRVDATNMGYIAFGSNASDLITFGENTTEYMRIDGSGNVGVGKTPVAKFDVNGIVRAQDLELFDGFPIIIFEDSGSPTSHNRIVLTGGNEYFGIEGRNSSNVRNDWAYLIEFGTLGADEHQIRVRNINRILINTTGTYLRDNTGASKISITTGVANGDILMGDDVDMNGNDIGNVSRIYMGTDITSGSPDYITWVTANGLRGFENGAEVFYIGGGQFSVTSMTSLTTANAANMWASSGNGDIRRSTSSIEYKANVSTFDDLTKLDQIRPVWFTSTADADDPNKQFIGFITEEVEAVIPEAVNDEHYDVRAIVAILVAEVKALKQQIANLGVSA